MNAPEPSELEVAIEGGVALVTLKRPHVMNALSTKLRTERVAREAEPLPLRAR